MDAKAGQTGAGTATRILDVAERLAQTRGFNGFSYADVAPELGISKAALHYHYASKAELGEALIDRYVARFADELDRIDRAGGDGAAKLNSYADLYASVLRDHRMCLCGILAADYETLPDPMRDRVLRFFDRNQEWLEKVVDAGKADGSLAIDGPASDAAAAILSSLEGAMLLARPYDDVDRFDRSVAALLAGLTTPQSREETGRSH